MRGVSEELAIEVNRLVHQEKLTTQVVARLTGLKRRAVARIASREGVARRGAIRRRTLGLTRCPTCGGLTRLPCRLCLALAPKA